MSTPVERPGGVTTVVVLTWFVAILTVGGGIWLLFAGDNALSDLGISSGQATTQGWVDIILGIVIALFASALGHGSGFARIMITILMIFRFVVASFGAVVLWGSQYFWPVVIAGLIAALVLYLLWNSRASAWFAAR